MISMTMGGRGCVKKIRIENLVTAQTWSCWVGSYPARQRDPIRISRRFFSWFSSRAGAEQSFVEFAAQNFPRMKKTGKKKGETTRGSVFDFDNFAITRRIWHWRKDGGANKTLTKGGFKMQPKAVEIRSSKYSWKIQPWKIYLPLNFFAKSAKFEGKWKKETKTKIISHICCCYFVYSEEQLEKIQVIFNPKNGWGFPNSIWLIFPVPVCQRFNLDRNVGKWQSHWLTYVENRNRK